MGLRNPSDETRLKAIQKKTENATGVFTTAKGQLESANADLLAIIEEAEAKIEGLQATVEIAQSQMQDNAKLIKSLAQLTGEE